MGKRFVNDDVIARLRRNRSADGRTGLLDDLAYAPA
jgi:hypothetical protein